MIARADWVIDIGPKAGRFGGQIISEGTPKQLMQEQTVTAQYMSGKMKIEVPKNEETETEKF
jgi:excinuclease ABC subunit A